jgi:hypothetical protein
MAVRWAHGLFCVWGAVGRAAVDEVTSGLADEGYGGFKWRTARG